MYGGRSCRVHLARACVLLRSGLRVHEGPKVSAHSRRSWNTVSVVRNGWTTRKKTANRRTNSRSRAGM